MTSNADFRRNVLRLMTANAYSNQSLAKAVGIAPLAIDIMLKSDSAEITDDVLAELAKALHCSTDDLLRKDEEKPAEQKTALDIMIENINAWTTFHGSVYELAKRSGMTASGLYFILGRKTSPSLTTIEKIAKGMNVSVAQLFTATGVQKKKSALYDTIYTAVLAALKEAK